MIGPDDDDDDDDDDGDVEDDDDGDKTQVKEQILLYLRLTTSIGGYLETT